MFGTSRPALPARVLLSLLLVAAPFAVSAPAHAEPAQDTTAPVVEVKPKAGGSTPAKLGLKKKKKKKPATRRALAVARKQVGDPYRYGASGPHAFDCSGLLRFSFRAAGFKKMPRTSKAQAKFARRISRRALRPGDLIFFTGSSGVYHAGIFSGRKNGKVVMVHAPSTGKRVSYASPWTNSWFAATLRR